MTATVVLRCDGTPTDRPGMTLERCRAYLPTPAHAPDEARHGHGITAGWTQEWLPAMSTGPAPATRTWRVRDLCPACSATGADQ